MEFETPGETIPTDLDQIDLQLFPPEIIMEVGDHLNTADLGKLAGANHYLQSILTGILYDRITLHEDIPQEDDDLPTRWEDMNPDSCALDLSMGPYKQHVLSWATSLGLERPIKYLLDRDTPMIHGCYAPDESPFHLAAMHNHVAVLRIFFTRSLAVCLENLQGRSKSTSALDIAIIRGHNDAAYFLLPFVGEQQLLNSLVTAAKSARVRLFTSIFSVINQIEFNALQKNETLLLSLDNAAACGNLEITRLLLPQIASDEVDESLLTAAACNQANVLRVLFDHMDNDRRPAVVASLLEETVTRGHSSVLEVLIDLGCDLKSISGSPGKMTLLHLTCHATIDESDTVRYKLLETAVILINNGLDVNVRDGTGSTPLHTIVECAPRGPITRPRLMLQTNRLAYFATRKAYMSMLELFISSGADINARDHLGRTALHDAIILNQPRTVELLLDCGADIIIRDTALGTVTQPTLLEFADMMVGDSMVKVIRKNERVALEAMVKEFETFDALGL